MKNISANILSNRDAFAWFEEEFGEPIRSVEDVEALDAEWSEQCENAFCYLHEFEIVS